MYPNAEMEVWVYNWREREAWEKIYFSEESQAVSGSPSASDRREAK
jgi:hypothetical protein